MRWVTRLGSKHTGHFSITCQAEEWRQFTSCFQHSLLWHAFQDFPLEHGDLMDLDNIDSLNSYLPLLCNPLLVTAFSAKRLAQRVNKTLHHSKNVAAYTLISLFSYHCLAISKIRQFVKPYFVTIKCFVTAQLALLSHIASNWLNCGVESKRWGTAHPSLVPYQVRQLTYTAM